MFWGSTVLAFPPQFVLAFWRHILVLFIGHWVLSASMRVTAARSCESQFCLNIDPAALALGLCYSRHAFVADWLEGCEAITKALEYLGKAAKHSLLPIKVRNPRWDAMGLQAGALCHIRLRVQCLHSYTFVQGKSSLNTMLIFFLKLLATFTDSDNSFKPVQRVMFNVSVGFLLTIQWLSRGIFKNLFLRITSWQIWQWIGKCLYA